MIDAVDIKVVDVEQQITIRGFEHGCEEFGLGYFLFERDVVGNVFDCDAPLEHILHLTDSLGGVGGRLQGERKRQEIVEMPSVAAKAQMLAIEEHPVLIEKLLQGAKKIEVERRWPA